MDIPDNLDITPVDEGGCLLIVGSASVQAYRDILISARLVEGNSTYT